MNFASLLKFFPSVAQRNGGVFVSYGRQTNEIQLSFEECQDVVEGKAILSSGDFGYTFAQELSCMDRESTAFGLSPKKVVDLLRIGSDTSSTSSDPEQEKAELLCNRLNEKLPVSASSSRKLAKKQGQMRRTIDALAGEPIGKLLQDPKTDMTLLRKAKNYGRGLSEQARTEAEHHTANVIYYAAIASALVFHNQRITNFSNKDLELSFTLLSKAKWIPSDLTGLFRKAGQHYQNKTQENILGIIQ